MNELEIRTIWRTAREQCEVVWGRFTGYRVRLWVEGRLIVDELVSDLETALSRGWDLRVEWPHLVE